MTWPGMLFEYSDCRAEPAGAIPDSESLGPWLLQQVSNRTRGWTAALHRERLHPQVRWCSPMGRGGRLKIGSVGVRIPPPAPTPALCVPPRDVPRRRIHRNPSEDLQATDFSQLQSTAHHFRVCARQQCPRAPTESEPDREEGQLHRGRLLLAIVALRVSTARTGKETHASDTTDRSPVGDRSGVSGRLRPRVHPFRRVQASANRTWQKLSGIRVLEPIRRYHRPVLSSV